MRNETGKLVQGVVVVFAMFLTITSAMSETFDYKQGGNPYFPIPENHFEEVDGIRYGYIIDSGRAMIFSSVYNGYTGYAHAANAVTRKIIYANGDVKYWPWEVRGNIIVPSILGGLPVTKIGRKAFQGCSNIISATIPEGVVDIEDMAFATNSAMKKFVCPESVTNIAGTAFVQCTNLTSITLKGNTKIQYRTSGLMNLRELAVPVMKVADFFYANNVTNLTITDRGAKNVNASLFGMSDNTYSWNCTKVERLTFLGDFTSIGKTTFSGTLPRLNEIRVTKSCREMVLSALENAGRNVKVVLIDREGNVICDLPVFASESGTEFRTSFSVSISCLTDGALIRYTTNGQDPTEDSALYEEPFEIYDTTTVKARAFLDGWVSSDITTVNFVRIRDTVETPTIVPDGAEFANTSQTVLLSCATDGATILYTTDGSDPRANGREYKHPFMVYNTCTVRAIAAKDDWKDSTEATATFTRKEALSAAANLYGYKMESGESAWTADGEVSHDGVSSIKSNGDGSYAQTSVRGAGTLSFWWRAMCEEPEDGEYYDYGVFKVGSAEAAYIAGNDTGWVFFSTNIATTGKHTLRWEYRKDDEGTFAPDCVWLDQVQWVPADGSGYTLTSPEPVPYSWLSQYGLGVASGDFETAANAAIGKTQGGAATRVWEEFVAGTDPTNALSVFTAKIEMQDGVPIVKWEPDLNTNGIQRMYKVYGRETLDAESPWQYPTNSLHRFFKVTVEMP